MSFVSSQELLSLCYWQENSWRQRERERLTWHLPELCPHWDLPLLQLELLITVGPGLLPAGRQVSRGLGESLHQARHGALYLWPESGSQWPFSSGCQRVSVPQDFSDIVTIQTLISETGLVNLQLPHTDQVLFSPHFRPTEDEWRMFLWHVRVMTGRVSQPFSGLNTNIVQTLIPAIKLDERPLI